MISGGVTRREWLGASTRELASTGFTRLQKNKPRFAFDGPKYCGMYCDRNELAEEIRISQRRRQISPRLIEIGYVLADAAFRKKWGRAVELDDYRQECVMRLAVLYRNIDPGPNPFSYITIVF